MTERDVDREVEREVVPVGPGPDEDGQVPRLDVEITPDLVETDSGGDAEDGAGASMADLEALLFVAERPLSRAELRTVARLSAEEVDARLGDLEVQLQDRGIRLVTSGDRVMLGTSPESGALIARYLGADAVRLSPAALETLAIIAYRQPVTRGVIERIRGVDSGHVVRGLLHRRLIHEQGRAESPGRPILYGTSMEFMERFGLTSLDDLPPLEAEIAAQLAQAEEDARSAGESDGGEADLGESDGGETDVGEGDADDAAAVDDTAAEPATADHDPTEDG
jgi:segregation and condensation protein B